MAELANTMAQNSNTGEEDKWLAPIALSIGLVLFTTTVCLYAELSILCHCVWTVTTRSPSQKSSIYKVYRRRREQTRTTDGCDAAMETL